jgi:hypothetical protein
MCKEFQHVPTGLHRLELPLSASVIDAKEGNNPSVLETQPFWFRFFSQPMCVMWRTKSNGILKPPKTCRSVSGSGQEIVHTFKKRGSMGYISPRFGRFEFWTYHPSFSLMFPFQFASLFISIAIAMGYDPFSNKPPYIVGSNPAYHKVCYTSDDGAIFSYFFHAGYHR